MKVIPFSPPDISEETLSEVCAALKSGWITTGPRVKELEKQIASRVGTLKAVCLNSNTACAELTLRIMGVGPGDEVIIPAYTYTATGSVVEHVGATIVMVDCEPGSFFMDWQKLENAISPRTKAIIPVDLFGMPCDYDRLFDLVECKRSVFQPSDNPIQRALGRIAVLGDAAHSFGAMYHDKPIGSWADFSHFSFHAVKNFTTAEGGATVWRKLAGIDDDWLYSQYMLYSLHGQNKDALTKTQVGAWEYDIKGLWYKCNMTDVCAAIGLSQMKNYDQKLARRRTIIEAYDQALASLPLRPFAHTSEKAFSSGHLYIVRLFDSKGHPLSEEQRNMFISALAELGVSANVHYKPLPMMTAYKNLGFSITDYPQAYEQYRNVVSLPLHTCLSDDDVVYVCDCVRQAYDACFGL